MSTTRTNDKAQFKPNEKARIVRDRYRQAKREVIRQCVTYMCEVVSKHEDYSKRLDWIYVITEAYDDDLIERNPDAQIQVKTGVTRLDQCFQARNGSTTQYMGTVRFGNAEYYVYPVIHGWWAFPIQEGKSKNYWEDLVKLVVDPWYKKHQVPQRTKTNTWDHKKKREVKNQPACIQTNRNDSHGTESRRIYARDGTDFVKLVFDRCEELGGMLCEFPTDFLRHGLNYAIRQEDLVDLFLEEQTLSFFLAICENDESNIVLYNYLFEGNIAFHHITGMKKVWKRYYSDARKQWQLLRDEAWEKVRSTYTEDDYDTDHEFLERQHRQFLAELDASPDYQVVSEDIRILRSALKNLKKKENGEDRKEESQDDSEDE